MAFIESEQHGCLIRAETHYSPLFQPRKPASNPKNDITAMLHAAEFEEFLANHVAMILLSKYRPSASECAAFRVSKSSRKLATPVRLSWNL